MNRSVYCLVLQCAIIMLETDAKENGLIRIEINDNVPASPDGYYNFHYKTSDGSERLEESEVRNAGQENQFLVVKGQYSYQSPDGKKTTVYYVADENGYRILDKAPIEEDIIKEVNFQAPAPGLLASLIGGGLG